MILPAPQRHSAIAPSRRALAARQPVGHPAPTEAESRLHALGWEAASGRFWDLYQRRRPRYAFLAPPLESIPNPSGNAIYCLMERLVERLGDDAIALAIKPGTGDARATPIRDRLLYYQRRLEPSLLARLVPYRLKKQIFGTSAPELREYGRSAGAALRALQVPGVVVEDVPILVSALADTIAPGARLVLHQHCNAPVGMPPRHWRNVCRSLKGIVFVARRAQVEAAQQQGEFSVPTQVIYNGVDLSHYCPASAERAGTALRARRGIAADDCVLLFAGRLLPGKGVAESAEAFNRANVRQARMLIVGDLQIRSYRDDAYLRRLRLAADKSAGRIELVGKVTQAELPGWYAASDAVIVPSLGPEGLPKIITEALAMGKPVLASDRGGSWELLREGKNGWLIADPADTASLARLLARVLSDRQALAHLSFGILRSDRPVMSEDRMVNEFAATLAEWCDEHQPLRV